MKFIKKHWNYILLALLPWVICIVHSLVNDGWPTGTGSILSGDALNVYYGMYCELWDKIRNGGSVFYTWNAGLGTDFYVNLGQYLISPFSLIILLLPKKMIASALQTIIMLKWSCIGITTAYYMEKTRFNKLPYRKEFVTFVLSLAFLFSNVVIEDLSFVSWLDIIIIFPLLVLSVERIKEDKTHKAFFGLMIYGFLCNARLMVPVCIFLAFWIFYSDGKAREYKIFTKALFFALLISAIVWVPSIMMTFGSEALYNNMSMPEYAGSILMSGYDVLHRYLFGDSLWIREGVQPMLYITVTFTMLAGFYILAPSDKKKKVSLIIAALFLILSLCIGALNLVMHGFIAVNENSGSYAFILTFVILHMALLGLENLGNVRMRYIAFLLLFAILGIVLAFLAADWFLDFYVYLFSCLIAVFVAMMIYFHRKKSIKDRNICIVICIVALLEMIPNAYIQMNPHAMYDVKEIYYYPQTDVLTANVKAENGERIAPSQTLPNAGLMFNKPFAQGDLAYTGENIRGLADRIGFASHDNYFAYAGGTKLLDKMFNITNGLSSDSYSFAELEKKGENAGYVLHESTDDSSIGYVVDSGIKDWDVRTGTAFEIQNDFIRKGLLIDQNMFKLYNSELVCSSILGGPRLENRATKDNPNGKWFHGQMTNSTTPDYSVPFNKKSGYYRYYYERMYNEDYISAKFVSDGETDYYAYVWSTAPFHIMIGIGDDYSDSSLDILDTERKLIHIGKVKKGETVSIVSDVAIDDLDYAMMYYRIMGLDEEVMDKAVESLTTYKLDVDTFKDTEVKGKMSSAEGVLMTSIPYAKGWTAKLDGKEVDTFAVGNALLSLDISKGEHEVEFTYMTPGFGAGLVISIVGIILLIGVTIYKKPVGKEDKLDDEADDKADDNQEQAE